MATNKAVRTDDGAGLNFATVDGAEDAVTKHWQRICINSPSVVGQMAEVSASSALKVDGSAVTQPVSVAATLNVRPSDGTNPITATYDLDSGVGAEWGLGVNLRKVASGGSVEAGTATDPLRVDPTGTTTQPISAASLPLPTGASTLAEQQTQTTALQLIDDIVRAEDEASGDGHKGAVILAVRKGTPANTSGTDGDYEALQMSAGRLWTSSTIDAALPTGDNNIGNMDVLSGPTGASAFQVQGTAAHDAAAVGNPVLLGAQMETMADSAPGTRSNADGDATKLATTDGAQFVIPTAPQIWNSGPKTGVQTGIQLHAAPGAGLSVYITEITFSIGAATASSIKILNNGGADIWGPHYLENISGRGMHIRFNTPLKATANTRVDVTTTGAATQTTDVQGFIAPG